MITSPEGDAESVSFVEQAIYNEIVINGRGRQSAKDQSYPAKVLRPTLNRVIPAIRQRKGVVWHEDG